MNSRRNIFRLLFLLKSIKISVTKIKVIKSKLPWYIKKFIGGLKNNKTINSYLSLNFLIKSKYM